METEQECSPCQQVIKDDVPILDNGRNWKTKEMMKNKENTPKKKTKIKDMTETKSMKSRMKIISMNKNLLVVFVFFVVFVFLPIEEKTKNLRHVQRTSSL